jgi:PadR family transcriptional regulator, regulatory protein PadR
MNPSTLRTQLLKGTTTMLVLSILEEGEQYGYEIAQQIRERSGDMFVPSEGSLYPALHRLETDGALSATWRASDRGPRRRYYRITPAGTKLLAATRREWASVTQAIGAVALRPAHG